MGQKLMPRIYRNKRDANEADIFDALLDAFCAPIRGHDADIYARHVDGYGVMLEVKTAKGRLRKIQNELAWLFKDRYIVVRTPTEALQACGVQVTLDKTPIHTPAGADWRES